MVSNFGDSPAQPRRANLWLAGFCAARIAFSMEMTTFSAAIGLLTAEWGLSSGQAGSISSAHHVGFLISLLAVGLLADRIGAVRTYLASSVFAALAALAFAAFARDYLSAFLLYGLLGLLSGGSYTPGLAILAQRYPERRRGRAIGFYIAASTAGYGLSLLVSSVMIPWGGWRAAFWATCLGPAVGMVLGWLMLRGVPNVISEVPAQPRQAGLTRAVVRNRGAMRMILAYVFHSWELLGVWAWIPYFLATVYGGMGQSAFAASMGAAFTAMGYLIGVGGPIAGGSLSDRFGRGKVIVALALVSSVSTLTLGWMAAAPFWMAVGVSLWVQFFAVADSPVLSTALTEVVTPRYLGAAYGLRSVLGFGAGAISPWVFGLVLDWGRGEGAAIPLSAWGLAFSVLGLGGLLAPLLLLRTRDRGSTRAV